MVINMMILIAIIPSIIIGLLVYKSDKKEKEPFKELLKAFLMGILSVIITLAISVIISLFDIDMDSLNLLELTLYVLLTIGLVEEFSKFLCVNIFLRNNKNYNYMYDGIVYSIYISLGFATIENILYLIDSNIALGIIRAVVTVPAHVFFAIFMGYYFSKYMYSISIHKKEKKYLLYSLLIPVILHTIFDTLLFSGNVVLAIIFIIFIVLLYVVSIKQMIKGIKEEKPFMEMNYCSQCGNKISGYYCEKCGKKVE